MPTRRALLAALAAVSVLSGCTSAPRTAKGAERLAYGDDPAQFGELYRPEGASRGVVAVIHGGFWRAQYDLTLGAPLAKSLASRGFTAWNLEYRRVGNGGGRPQTFDDIAAGIDRLADVDGLDTSTLVTLGHSAGGQLAAWAAARGRFDRWKPERVPVTAVISQSGVLDMTLGAQTALGGDAVQAFLGSGPDDGDGYAEVDPTLQVPLTQAVWAIHGTDDTTVPLDQSTSYVDAATSAGATATLVTVPGDHFALIDTASAAWRRTLGILDDIAG